MDVREKLMELLLHDEVCKPDECKDCAANGCCYYHRAADRIIAHGVTVQEWVSVKDRLPKLIPCSVGTAYSEAVNVLTSGRKVLTAIWDGTNFIADADFWDAEGEEITHWTPVLLPLPETAKEGQ